jgi:hypothetical protein
LNDLQFNRANRVAKAACRQILNALSEISQINPHFRAQIYALAMDNGNLLDRSNILNNPSKLALYRWSIIIAGRPIKKELGQDVVDSKQKLIQKLHKKIENVNIPEYARKVFDEGIAKLKSKARLNLMLSEIIWSG